MSILRVILMIVLTLGVIAGAGWLAMSTGAENDGGEDARIERLIRLLGDSDPDVSRKAGDDLRLLLPASRPALEEASRSKDTLLAMRARALLPGDPAVPIP